MRLPTLLRSLLLVFWGRVRIVPVVEVMFLDVLDHWPRQQILDAHVPLEEHPDLGTAHVVLDHLRDDVDVVLPRLQAGQSLVHVRAATFYDHLHGFC